MFVAISSAELFPRRSFVPQCKITKSFSNLSKESRGFSSLLHLPQKKISHRRVRHFQGLKLMLSNNIYYAYHRRSFFTFICIQDIFLYRVMSFVVSHIILPLLVILLVLLFIFAVVDF